MTINLRTRKLVFLITLLVLAVVLGFFVGRSTTGARSNEQRQQTYEEEVYLLRPLAVSSASWAFRCGPSNETVGHITRVLDAMMHLQAEGLLEGEFFDIHYIGLHGRLAVLFERLGNIERSLEHIELVLEHIPKASDKIRQHTSIQDKESLFDYISRIDAPFDPERYLPNSE